MGKKRGFAAAAVLLVLLLVSATFLLGYFLGKGVTIFPSSQQDATTAALFGENYQEITASESSQIITHGPRDNRKIALTFDAEMTDGMKAALLSGKSKSSFDRRIIETLRQTKTEATIFLTGMWIELYPGETHELSMDPLIELGSHSYTDSSFEGYCYGLKKVPNDTSFVEEIGSTEKLLRKYADFDNKLFRFPGGCYSPHAVELVNQANDIVVHWDVNGFDGFNNSADNITQNVVSKVQNGSIIILHLNGDPTAPKTAEALPKIITTLKGKGFEFVKVSKLLGL